MKATHLCKACLPGLLFLICLFISPSLKAQTVTSTPCSNEPVGQQSLVHQSALKNNRTVISSIAARQQRKQLTDLAQFEPNIYNTTDTNILLSCWEQQSLANPKSIF
jgi:hypothetical protein